MGIRGQLLFRPNDDIDITLSGDYSSQNPECCGGVFVGYGPTQRAENRQFPALAAALGYEPASLDPFDRLTDLDASRSTRATRSAAPRCARRGISGPAR